MDFSSVWHDLGFGGCLFLFKIPLKKYSKIDFSSFWHDLGFGGSLFLFKIQSSEVMNNCFCLAVGTILVVVAACFYSKLNSKKVLQI